MSGQESFVHLPVLSERVVEMLLPGLTARPGGRLLVDCTLGGGGHSNALLRAAPDAQLLGIDADDSAIEAARAALAWASHRIRLVRGNFEDLLRHYREGPQLPVGAVLYDLGVSSPQLDLPARGFGYRGDGGLDMRMDRSLDISAEDIVNGYEEAEIARIISSYGEERFARRIARSIVRRREQEPFQKAGDLAEVIKSAIPAPARRTGPHPARRTFQALRIAVNRELDVLQRSLPDAIDLLAPSGRVGVISYHSLEDRIAKRTFTQAMKGCTCPRDLPVCVCGKEAIARVITRKPVRASEAETSENPRADSARLRVAEKLATGEAA